MDKEKRLSWQEAELPEGWELHVERKYLRIIRYTPDGAIEQFKRIDQNPNAVVVKARFKDSKTEITPAIFRIYTRKVSILNENGITIENLNVCVVNKSWVFSLALGGKENDDGNHTEVYFFNRSQDLKHVTLNGVQEDVVTSGSILNEQIKNQFNSLADSFGQEANVNLHLCVGLIEFMKNTGTEIQQAAA